MNEFCQVHISHIHREDNYPAHLSVKNAIGINEYFQFKLKRIIVFRASFSSRCNHWISILIKFWSIRINIKKKKHPLTHYFYNFGGCDVLRVYSLFLCLILDRDGKQWTFSLLLWSNWDICFLPIRGGRSQSKSKTNRTGKIQTMYLGKLSFISTFITCGFRWPTHS